MSVQDSSELLTTIVLSWTKELGTQIWNSIYLKDPLSREELSQVSGNYLKKSHPYSNSRDALPKCINLKISNDFNAIFHAKSEFVNVSDIIRH